MKILERKGLSQDQRFRYATILALITAIALGLLTGFIRTFYESVVWMPFIGLGVAYVVRRYGRGVQTRFSVMAVIFTVFAILLSDVYFNFGLLGLLDFESYRLALTFGVIEEMSRLAWIVARVLTVFVAYSYSRVV